MFRIGQKVVCVDDTEHHPSTMIPGGKRHSLVKGQIYTVTKTGIEHPLDLIGIPCIALAKMPSPYGYRQTRFRPLVEKTTDISVFKALLNPIQERENV